MKTISIETARLEAWIAYWDTFDPDKDSEVEAEAVITDMRDALRGTEGEGRVEP